MEDDLTESLRRDALVLAGCSVLLIVITQVSDVGHVPLAVAFGVVSLLALGFGLSRGMVWYKAGHWLPIAAVAAVVAVTPTEALREVAAIMVVIGIANIVIAPLYERMETAGENLLK